MLSEQPTRLRGTPEIASVRVERSQHHDRIPRSGRRVFHSPQQLAVIVSPSGPIAAVRTLASAYGLSCPRSA
jgi:hypothetical protein